MTKMMHQEAQSKENVAIQLEIAFNPALLLHSIIYQSFGARMVTTSQATHYKMNHKYRGIALVFNHEHFKITSLRSRTGTQADCQAFKQQLKRMGFEVVVFHDLNYLELHDQVMKGICL